MVVPVGLAAAAVVLAGAASGCVEGGPPREGSAEATVLAPSPGDDGPLTPDRPDPTVPDPGEEDEPEGLCHVTLACDGGILDEPKTPCTISVADAQGEVEYDGRAGVELRGRSSLDFPKPHLGIELRTHSELPVWPGSTWAYLDDGSDPGPGWREPSFDDSAWADGRAPLGFGGEWIDTEIASPQGPSVTTYYRREFTPADLGALTELLLGVQARDGVAVWLNGVEIYRSNLPQDAGPDTLATAAIVDEDTPWLTEKLGVDLVVPGTNVLAVEVHLASDDAAESRFNLYLEGSGDDVSVPLLGMGREEDWILNGQYVDRALFRNRLAYDVFQSFGGPERYATKTRFCEVDLDGEYMGIFTLGEKLERDDDRIDISEGSSPGASFIVKLDDEGGFHDNAIGRGTWQLVYPDPTPEAEAAVTEELVRWEDAVLGPDPADPDTGIFSVLDLDSAVDWVLLNELTKNADAYILSIHLWKDEGGKMFFAPWDLDLSLGSYPYTDCSASGWVHRSEAVFLDRMTEVPAFRDRLVSRWQELRQTVLAEDALVARIAGYDAILAPALPADLERWPVEDVAFGWGDVDNWLCPVSSYQEEHDRTVAFLRERLAWMDANLASF